MKFTFLAALAISLFLFHSTAFSQDEDTTYWNNSGVFNLTGSQVSLTNWQAGGENSVALNGFFNYKIQYQKDNISWDNFAEAAFGASRLSEGDFFKTDDRYEVGTKLGYRLNSKLDLTAFSTFRTQFTEGFKTDDETGEVNRISHSFAPAYLFGGIGTEWEPVDWFKINVAPLSTKITYVRIQELADRGEFGVDPAEFDSQGNMIAEGKNARYEFGGYVKIWLKKEIFENVTVETKADFFSNYLEKTKNIDVTWDLMINMKVNSWLSANLTTNLIYDDDINIRVGTDEAGNPIAGPRTQFKQVLGAGLSFKL